MYVYFCCMNRYQFLCTIDFIEISSLDIYTFWSLKQYAEKSYRKLFWRYALSVEVLVLFSLFLVLSHSSRHKKFIKWHLSRSKMAMFSLKKVDGLRAKEKRIHITAPIPLRAWFCFDLPTLRFSFYLFLEARTEILTKILLVFWSILVTPKGHFQWSLDKMGAYQNN